MASTLEPAAAPAAVSERPYDVARRTGVLGLGTALPDDIVGNDRVAAAIGVEEEWIVRRTGVHERRHAAPGAQLSELAAEAGRAALADAGVDPADLDLVILATFTADAIVPPASASVAHLLGAERAGTFDLNNACSGFVTALATADGLIRGSDRGLALVIGAEIISRHLDHGDRKTAAIFADGAGALVIGGDAPGGFGPFVMGSDGSQAHLLTIDPASATLRMDGYATFKQALARLAEASLGACEAAGVELADLDLLVFHQANSRITSALTERLALDPERVVDCIGELGNTSAATIPLALAHARRERRLHRGQKVLLAAAGAGFTWAATVVDWELS